MKVTEQYLLISFMATKFSRLKKHWDKHNKLKNKGILGTNKTLPPSLGGKVIILDWNTKKVLWDIDLDLPTGVLLDKDFIFANSLRNEVCVIDHKKIIINKIKNKNLNSPHTIEKTQKGYLITSSGLDLILEIDIMGNTLFKWSALDHGFTKDPQGNTRSLVDGVDYSREIFTTLCQTTHVNSAIYDGDKHILATLFHQGTLIRINKKNGNNKVLLAGLSNPHAIHKNPKGFILSDTNNNSVLLLDKKFKIINTVSNNFKWVQDAISLDGNYLIADADNNRIMEISINGDRSHKLSEFYYNKEWRIFQIKKISPSNWLDFSSS